MSFRDSKNVDAAAAAELFCPEKAAFTPYPISASSCKMNHGKQMASTPYHPLQWSGYQFTSSLDDKLVEDSRVIENMRRSEANNARASSYYLRNTNVNDNMRKILLRWMYEVVTDQQCEDLLFVLAANYLDRFLSRTTILQGQLQLLGCCCLLLASKLRNCMIISAEVLADLTDGAHTEEEICKFELVVLAQLGWDMSPILPSDYLEPVLRQAGLDTVPNIRRHSITFLSMATLYSSFLDYPPSYLACASIYAALTYTHGDALESHNAFLAFVCTTFSISKLQLEDSRQVIFLAMNQELALHEKEDISSAVDGPSAKAAPKAPSGGGSSDGRVTVETREIESRSSERGHCRESSDVSCRVTDVSCRVTDVSCRITDVDVYRDDVSKGLTSSDDSGVDSPSNDSIISNPSFNDSGVCHMYEYSDDMTDVSSCMDSSDSGHVSPEDCKGSNDSCLGDLTPTDIMDITLE